MSRTRHYYYPHFPYRETETWRGRICGLDPLDFLPYHDCLMYMPWYRVLGYLRRSHVVGRCIFTLISPPSPSPQPISSDLKNCRVR